MRLRIARFALSELIYKPLFLIDGVVQLGESVGELSPVDEKFKAIRDARIVRIALRER